MKNHNTKSISDRRKSGHKNHTKCFPVLKTLTTMGPLVVACLYGHRATGVASDDNSQGPQHHGAGFVEHPAAGVVNVCYVLINQALSFNYILESVSTALVVTRCAR
jgi:hypothetical protein